MWFALSVSLCFFRPQRYLINTSFQTKALHTIIRDKNTSKQDFVFYADRLIRIVVEAGLGCLPFGEKIVTTPTGKQYVPTTLDTHTHTHSLPPLLCERMEWKSSGEGNVALRPTHAVGGWVKIG